MSMEEFNNNELSLFAEIIKITGIEKETDKNLLLEAILPSHGEILRKCSLILKDINVGYVARVVVNDYWSRMMRYFI